MSKSLLSLFNLALRGTNLASKFILIIFLAKWLSADDLGLYGLFSATIYFVVYLIGLDFYVYSNRELLKNPDSDRNAIIQSHLQLIAIVYMIILPLLSGIFLQKMLPVTLLIPFYALIILEHLNQEVMRFFITMGRPILANALFFIRSGGWSFFIILMYFIQGAIGLKQILSIWCWAEFICFLLSITFLSRQDVYFHHITKIDYNWIIKGLKICLPFLLGTLAIKAIFTGDRYILEIFSNNNALAAYVFYASIAAATLSFMDAAVFSFDYPLLVKSINAKNNNYKLLIKQMYIKTAAYLSVIFIFSIPIIQFLIDLIGKPYLHSYIHYFYYLMIIQVIYCISTVPHYVLYALGNDKAIIISHLVALLIFLLFSFLFISKIKDNMGLFLALFAAFSFIFTYKYIKSKKALVQYEYSHSC